MQLSEMVTSCEEFASEASRLQHSEASQVEQLFLELKDALQAELKRMHRYQL